MPDRKVYEKWVHTLSTKYYPDAIGTTGDKGQEDKKQNKHTFTPTPNTSIQTYYLPTTVEYVSHNNICGSSGTIVAQYPPFPFLLSE